MVNYATFQDIMNRLGRSSLECSLANLTGALDDGENALGGTSTASIYIISQNGDKVEYRLVTPDGANNLEYGETLTGVTSVQSGILMFAESTFINELIAQATGEINDHIDYEYGDPTLTKTEPFTAEDEQEYIFLKFDNIQSISSITHKGESLGTEDTDYWLFENAGYIQVKPGKLYAYQPKDLIVSYVYGTDTVPGGLTRICSDMVLNVLEDYFRGKDTGGADKISLADYSADYIRRDMLTPEIAKRLVKYTRTGISAI